MNQLLDSLFSNYNNSQIISIGLTLPEDQSAAAIEFSRVIKHSFPVEFVLDKEERPPFVRLYETVFPTANIPKLMETVESIAAKTTPIQMKWNGLEIAYHNLILWGKQNDVLENFHRDTLTQLNPYRNGYFKQKYSGDNRTLTLDEINSLHKWGSPWAENYVPHMVIAKSVDTFSVSKLEELEWGFGSCLLNGLLVGEKKPHGGFVSFRTFPFKEAK